MSLWKRKTPEERIAALVSEAEEALEAGEFERALKAGQKIIGLQHTYGFELKARALVALEREPEALALMEQSVKLAPGVGKLWSLLGEYRSDAGDYAGAHAAFARAGELDPALLQESILNDAIVFAREQQPARAWSRLECITTPEDPSLRAAVAAWRADTLLDLCRFEEAIALCTTESEAITARLGTDRSDEDELESLSRRLLVSKATALWRGRRDSTVALELCYSAVKHVKSRGSAFDLVREIGGLDASRAKCFQLLCHGKALTRFLEEGVAPESVPETEQGYFTTFRVLADTAEEALEFVQHFEGREWGEKFRSLVLEKSSETTDRLEGCKGIYFRSGRTFYSGRADNDESGPRYLRK